MKNAALISVLACALAGCGAGADQELEQWMSQQKAVTKPTVQPIPEPKQYVPQAYEQAAAIDPFNGQKLAQALRNDANQSVASSALIAPELSRRKEPLESFPLDAVSMVGSLIKDGRPVALVKVDNLLYQVQVGNYLGQNYGRITRVSETAVDLREIVQDPTGEWIERTATLQLQERAK